MFDGASISCSRAVTWIGGTGYVVSALDELKAGIVKTGSSFELAMLSPLLVSASPRLLGGVKSQLSLQIVLGKLGVHVIPESLALGAAHPCLRTA